MLGKCRWKLVKRRSRFYRASARWREVKEGLRLSLAMLLLELINSADGLKEHGGVWSGGQRVKGGNTSSDREESCAGLADWPLALR